MAVFTSRPRLAIAFVLLAWLFFTSAIAIGDRLGPTMPVPVILLFQNIFSMLVILPKMFAEERSIWKVPNLRLLSLRFLAGYLNFAFIFLAVQKAPLTGVLLLGNSAPFFIPIIIWIWRGIKLSSDLWLGIIVGFLGIALILRPSGNLLNLGGLFAIAAGLSAAISLIAQRRLVKKEPPESILFYYFFLGAIVSLPLALSLWKPLDAKELLSLCALGILSGIGQYFLLKALQFEKPSLLSPFNYSSIVYGALIQWLIWHQPLGWVELIGITIVVVGSLLTMRAAKGEEQLK